MPGSSATLKERLGLERNIVAVSGAMLLLSLGESLWRKFLPKYLQALGAPGGILQNTPTGTLPTGWPQW